MRSNTQGELAPIQIGGPFGCTGFGHDQMGSKFTNSP